MKLLIKRMHRKPGDTRKPQRQLQRAAACNANDCKFALSQAMSHDRRTSDRHAEWLLHNARSISAVVAAHIASVEFRMCLLLAPFDDAFTADLKKQADAAMLSHSNRTLAKLLLISRSKMALQWLRLHPSEFDGFVGVLSSLSTCSDRKTAETAEWKREWTRDQWTSWLTAKLTGVDATWPVSEALHVARWCMLDMLRRHVRKHVKAFESTRDISVQDSSKTKSTSDEADAVRDSTPPSAIDAFTDPLFAPTAKSRAKELPLSVADSEAPAAAATSAAEAAAATAADASTPLPTPKRKKRKVAPPTSDAGDRAFGFMKEALYHIHQMQDHYAFLFQRHLYGCKLHTDRANRMITCSAFDDPNGDLVNERTIPFIQCAEALCYTASDDRKKTPVVFILAKCLWQKNVGRMWPSSYPSYLEFDARQLNFTQKIVLCSLLGNYRHFTACHPSHFVRYYLLTKWFEVARRGDCEFKSHADFSEPAPIPVLWDWLLFMMPYPLLHMTQHFILYRLRSRPIVDAHRKSLHLNPVHVTQAEIGNDRIVARFRRFVELCRPHIVAACPWSPATPGDGEMTIELTNLAKRLNSHYDPLSESLRVQNNYPKTHRAFFGALRVVSNKVAVLHSELFVLADEATNGKLRSAHTAGGPAIDCLAVILSYVVSESAASLIRSQAVDDIATQSDAAVDAASDEHPARTSDAKGLLSVPLSAPARDAGGLYSESGQMRTISDPCVGWGMREAEFNLICRIVDWFPDPAYPRPEYFAVSLLSAMGSSAAAIELVEQMISDYTQTKRIRPVYLEMQERFPMTLNRLRLVAFLWERKAMLKTYWLTHEQRVQQMAVLSERSDRAQVPVTAACGLYCTACQMFRSSFRDRKSSSRHPERLAAASGFPDVLVKISNDAFATRPLSVTAVCKGDKQFNRMKCSDPASLKAITTIGKVIEFRGDVLLNCMLCGVLSIIDQDRCMYAFGGYCCHYCTVTYIAALELMAPQFRASSLNGRPHPLVISLPFAELRHYGSGEATLLDRLLLDSRNRNVILAAEEAERQAARAGIESKRRTGEDGDSEASAGEESDQDVEWQAMNTFRKAKDGLAAVRARNKTADGRIAAKAGAVNAASQKLQQSARGRRRQKSGQAPAKDRKQ